jgi:beta-lactamase regulating signal transducer with metallopeptidase domain
MAMGAMLHVFATNAVLATGLAVLAVCFGRIHPRPAFRHLLWLLVLVKLITPPLVTIPLSRLALPQTPSLRWVPEPGPAAAEPDASGWFALTHPSESPTLPSMPTAARDWARVLRLVWLVGSGAWFALAFIQVYRSLHFSHRAYRAPAQVQQQARDLARSMGLKQCPEIWAVRAIVSPMMWWLGGSARILIPALLLESLGEEQRATLLVHELAHLRRRDHWTRLLEFVVTGLYWWHPIVWWARREIRRAEEECCDAWVLWALPRAGHAYATTLLQTLDFLADARPALPLGASGIGYVSHLRRRLTMIMIGKTLPGLTAVGRWGLLAMALVLMISFESQADPENAPKKHPRGPSQLTQQDLSQERQTLQGTVQKFTTGPKGDVHGFVLNTGTEVRFPPHLEKRVTAVATKGDRVQVSGRLHTGPRGDTHFEADSITNLNNQASIKIDHPPPPVPKTVQGIVQKFTTGPKGDVHGFLLKDGTEVRFPPHMEKRVTAAVAKDDRVRVSGRLHTGPKGDTHLEAESITNLGSQATVQIDHPPQPQPRTVQGTVQEFTAGPKGYVHGFVLSDGSNVHFPPHMEKRVTAAVAKGDRVRVSGRLHTGPKGDTHLEAESITNLGNQTTVNIDHPPPPEPKTVQGTVQEFTTAPKGDVHGFLLNDGTDVHFPPHMEKRITAAVAKGDRVRVSGGLHVGPKGDTHLDAESITNLGSQTMIRIDHPPPPPDARKEKR